MNTSKLCLVEGNASTGKSFSLKSLDPKTTFVHSCSGKGMAWINWQKDYNKESKNYAAAYDAGTIVKVIDTVDKNPEFKHITTLVIDDYQYSQSFGFMNDIKTKGYEKFNLVAENNYKIFKRLAETRDDLFCVVISHTEIFTDVNGMPAVKFKTIGKATDNWMEIDGLVNFIFYSAKEMNPDGSVGYYFYTEKVGTPARALYGAFTETKIPNDLEAIRKIVMGL